MNKYSRGGTVWSQTDPIYQFSHLLKGPNLLFGSSKREEAIGLSNLGIMLPKTMNQVLTKNARTIELLGESKLNQLRLHLQKIRRGVDFSDLDNFFVPKTDLITEISTQSSEELFSSLLNISYPKGKDSYPSGTRSGAGKLVGGNKAPSTQALYDLKDFIKAKLIVAAKQLPSELSDKNLQSLGQNLAQSALEYNIPGFFEIREFLPTAGNARGGEGRRRVSPTPGNKAYVGHINIDPQSPLPYVAKAGSMGASPRRNGGMIQKFMNGGVAQRNLGYIDYDVIANSANEAVVSKGMEAAGVTGPRLYADYLTDLAVKKRKENSLSKLKAIYGVAGSGKTTLARGQGTDNATLRQTTRFPVLTPEDIDKANEILILSSSVSKKKLDEIFSVVDKA